MTFGSILWRLHTVRALAFEGLGRTDDASRESVLARTQITALAERIADPELRAWFERQTESFEVSPSRHQ